MPKVYIGGLPPDIDQPAILSLLEDKNLRGHQSVEIKRGGYAFVQFGEEREAERAVAVLHGMDKFHKGVNFFTLPHIFIVCNTRVVDIDEIIESR